MDLPILRYILILSLDLQQPSLYIYIYIYMCVCVCVCVCVCCSSKERIKIYFKIGRSTKRFVFFKSIYFVLTYVLYMCMFHIHIYNTYVAFVREHMAQGLGNGILNKTWTYIYICIYIYWCYENEWKTGSNNILRHFKKNENFENNMVLSKYISPVIKGNKRKKKIFKLSSIYKGKAMF